MRTRIYIKNLRHDSLQMNVFYMHVNFNVWEMIIKGDILDQKIKVEKSIFKFSTPSFFYSSTYVHITYISKRGFLLTL